MPAFSLRFNRIGLTPHKHIISIKQLTKVSQEGGLFRDLTRSYSGQVSTNIRKYMAFLMIFQEHSQYEQWAKKLQSSCLAPLLS